MESVKFQVEDMIWPSCAAAIEMKLAAIEGVSAASADSNSKEVTVLLAHAQSCERIYCAVEDLGYHIADSGNYWFGS